MAKLKDIAAKFNVDINNETSKSNINNNIGSTKSTSTKRRTWLENEVSEEVCLIDTSDISNWEYHDRPTEELGDIDALAQDFINVGQQQPCIVRPTPIGTKFKYELIIGERRWRAAKQANIKLKVIIKDLSDNEAAICQAAENDNRKDLSDYAKGMSYSRLIEKGILKQKDLIEKLGRPRQYISALLSYSKIPDEIIKSIGDMTHVSCRTAETINRLAKKGDVYIEAILSKADSIRNGKIGHNKLSEIVLKQISSSHLSNKKVKNKIYSSNGRHLFTWRKDNNDLPSLHFPKDISVLLDNKIDLEKLTEKLTEVIENELSKLK